ncbi:MAG: hypothetical protein JNJ45_04435 [Chthonomonas sp.]|nr:hypothetical protein [Chthonomonas sp.]
MAQSVEKIEKALKLKATPKVGALSLKVGAKRVTLPFDVRVLSSEGSLFVHIPPSAGLFSLSGKDIKKIDSVDAAQTAVKSFRSRKGRGASKAKASAAMPLSPELEAALSKIPAGYKLVSDAKGSRLVRSRARKTK